MDKGGAPEYEGGVIGSERAQQDWSLHLKSQPMQGPPCWGEGLLHGGAHPVYQIFFGEDELGTFYNF